MADEHQGRSTVRLRVGDTFALPAPETVAATFAEEGVVVIRDAITAAGRWRFEEAMVTLWTSRFRREFLMPQSEHSPRNMTVIGGQATGQAEALMAAYADMSLLAWCSAVAGRPVDRCPNRIEHVIYSILEKPGDTHGWHRDDYPIAFIIVLEMPKGGGRLEVGSPEEPRHVPLAAGDIYLMRSDLTHHRVSPLTSTERRVILNFTYAWEGVPVMENGSADLLCAE